MAGQEYQVRISAETKQATDKIDAVQNSLDSLTKKDYSIKVAVDANALKRSAEQSEQVANNIKRTASSIREASSVDIISGNTLNNAASLAGTFYGIRKDIRGIESDLGKALGQTNVSEFMRTEKFLDRILDVSKSRTREITETYKNIREVPGAADLLGPIENFARSKAWEQFGGQIADQTLQGMRQGLQQGVQETKKFFYADLFEEIVTGTNRAIDTLARLGLAIQGVQLLVGPLAATWSAAFDSIIGQNVRLQETILATQTTLASTGRVINQATGEELKDPLQKINALESGVRDAIDNIRVRSLDLAGVTSSQIIDIFGVVATSISQIGGNLKDAENLAISFTAALGTLGIPLYQARQEIGSIMGGYITEDSLLAKRLQISNADIAKARSSIDGVVGYLQKKLETAVAGQAISSKQFTGVISNIKEVFEVIGQRIGEPLLGPIVKGLNAVYEVLKKIQPIIVGVGSVMANTIVSAISTIVNAVQNSGLARSIGQAFEAFTAPFEKLTRASAIGLNIKGFDLIQEYTKGLLDIPPALKSLIDGLFRVGNFIRLQISLIIDPILKLLDQSRERLQGPMGAVQAIARAPQFAFFEGTDAFTKGWDTIASTIQYAAQALSKFAAAFVQLKVTELTAQIRAAATVFELFGSILLGKVNLALAFFDTVANVLGSDITKFAVSMAAVNKLLNNTELFGMKGLLIWLTQTRVLFNQLIGDTRLFVKGFKDAGNINNILANTQGLYGKVYNIGAESKNPVIQNAAQIEQMTQRLASLNAMQAQMAKNGAGAEAMARYGAAISGTNEKLAALKKTQESFTATQRAGAAVKSLLGGGAEAAAAKEAARQSSVMLSGAASAQALSGVMDTLRQKLGLTEAQMKGLGGAVNVAGRSLQTFLTTSLMINIGFTAATLAISALISYYQQQEERTKKLANEGRNLAAVQKILASGYGSIMKAAEGGDVAAQNFLNAQRSAAQNAFQEQSDNLERLREKYGQLNNDLYGLRKMASAASKDPLVLVNTPAIFANKVEKEITENKKEQLAIQKKIYAAQQAINKLQQEEQLQQDYKILAERRKEIEEKIKTAREDYTKEIVDKEFQARMEILNNERTIREAMVEKEKRAVAERYQLLIDTSSEQERKALELAKNYETALLNAADAEDQRRTDILQKEMQLRKDMEDYIFRMAREKINLEKQVGNYAKGMETFKNKQQAVRMQREVDHMRSVQRLQSPYFAPYNLEQQQGFVNSAQNLKQQGIPSAQYAYAALSVIPKQVLGIIGDEPIGVVLNKLAVALQNRTAEGRSNELPALVKEFGAAVTDEGSQRIATLLQQYGIKELGTQRFFNANANATNVGVPNLNIDWTGYTKTLADLNTTLRNSAAAVAGTRADAARDEVLAALRAIANPKNLTNINPDYDSELKQLRTELTNSSEEIKSWNSGMISANTALNNLRTSFEIYVQSLLSGRTFIQALKKKPFIDTMDVDKYINDLIESLFTGRLRLGNNIRGSINIPGKARNGESVNVNIPQQTALMLSAAQQALIDARVINQKGLPQLQQLNQTQGFASAAKGTFGPENVGQAFSSQYQQLNEAIASLQNQAEEGARYSLDRTIANIRTQATTSLEVLKSQFPELSKQFETELTAMSASWSEAMIDMAKKLDPLRQKLQSLTDAQIWKNNDDIFGGMRQGMESFITSLGTLKSNIADFTNNTLQGLSNAFVELFTTGTTNFRQLAANIVADMTRIIFQQLVLKNILGGLFGGPDFKPVGGGLFGFANGGIMTSAGPLPLRSYAGGGVANSPQMALFGEGSKPEAFVPLPDGKSIPVSFDRSNAQGSGNVSVNVNVDAKGTQAQGNSTKSEEIGRVIANAVQEEILRMKRPGGLLAS